MGFLYFVYFILLGFLAFNVLFLLLFALAGRFGKADDRAPSTAPRRFRKIGVLIPAYKEDAVILDSIKANLNQDYPAAAFDLIVIADSLKPETLAKLAQQPIRVIEVSFEFSTVTKAISTALARLPEGVYDIVAVSDADNHMAKDFLSRINAAFEQGWQAVQGHRVAKNTDTSVAILDAISEEMNNHIFRKGSRALGLSSNIIGSGMAFDFKLMKDAMADLSTVGGYDKELEMKVVLAGYKVAYLEKAMIYDEKVSKSAVFEKQRTRWIAAQWQFLQHYFRRGMSELFRGRMASAAKTLQALVLPRVLLLGVLFLTFALSLFSSRTEAWAIPGILLLTLCFTLAISVPAYLWKRVTMRELLMIPVLMLRFARAVFNIRKAFKSFLHTPHTN